MKSAVNLKALFLVLKASVSICLLCTLTLIAFSLPLNALRVYHTLGTGLDAQEGGLGKTNAILAHMELIFL